MKHRLIKHSALVSLAERTIAGFAQKLYKEYMIDASLVRHEEIDTPLVAERLTACKFGNLPVAITTQDSIDEFITDILHQRYRNFEGCGCFEPDRIAYRKRFREANSL